jgi:hypothetical protein
VVTDQQKSLTVSRTMNTMGTLHSEKFENKTQDLAQLKLSFI